MFVHTAFPKPDNPPPTRHRSASRVTASEGNVMSLPVTTAAPPPSEPPEPSSPASSSHESGPAESTPAPRPRAAITATAGAAIVAAVALSWDRPGIGWLLTALAVAAAIVVSAGSGFAWSGRTAVRAGEAVAVVALIAVGAVRAAEWLFVLCMFAAGVVGCVALADRWSAGSLVAAPLRVVGSVPAALRWLLRDAIRIRVQDRGAARRTTIAGLVAVALLAVFGFLLAEADAAFAEVLSVLIPSVDGSTSVQWLGSAAAAVVVTAVAAYGLLTGTTVPEPESRLGLVRRIEWALPVGGLVALFAGFVAVQATVLFGGGEHVAKTAELTYAEYARAGFWQLLVVTGLTVIVVGVAARIAPRATVSDRVLLRTLLGLLSALTLVIVASALSRMAAYEQAYGFTRQRLLVTVGELWLGVLFLLILLAGIKLRGRWVPRAALAAAVGALIGLAVLNPDAFIAQQNVNRFEKHGIDVYYLSTLSADAVPALQKLPEPYRSCALAAITNELTGGSAPSSGSNRRDAWQEWNLGRATARAHLDDDALGPCPAAYRRYDLPDAD
ncbi:DUF4173 domain-containing protein [Micromonospora sp. WMMD956]|uniref:DUF4153 domain-containing protein n=1 Tax=Micromonospora sp. WMMD956 TaxID=3016108 RepID=UPI002415C311|nr:DUF4173 domain-containing protein [Micromonospora sp. WMMD956]MDG4816068.1 DUF4173 domain-containing protein [Micromonospora sp. WMMD956]